MSPWLNTRRTLGEQGECLAADFLTAQGYTIDARNVRFPVGEIDLVAWERGTLCFVEVRSASSTEWGGPLASVTDRKRRRLIRAARWHLNRLAALPEEIRFDIVAVQWRPDGAPAVELLRGAFDAGE